jgi:hypothetical protein
LKRQHRRERREAERFQSTSQQPRQDKDQQENRHGDEQRQNGRVAGDNMGGQDHDVPGDMRGEEAVQAKIASAEPAITLRTNGQGGKQRDLPTAPEPRTRALYARLGSVPNKRILGGADL